MASTTTYLQIVNNTIQEAGVSLASFAVDGSDFNTQTNAQMNRFKLWVSRAWKDIQQSYYDWDFMNEIGLVNLDPGIMFYTDGTPVSTFSSILANTTFNIYDQDGTVAIPNLTAGAFTDLTGTATLTQPFGYFNIAGANLNTPLNIALKPGAEYIYIPYAQSGTFTSTTQWSYHAISGGTLTGVVDNISPDPQVSPIVANVTIQGVTYTVVITFFSNVNLAPATLTIQGSSAAVAALDDNPGPFTFVDPRTGATLLSWTGHINTWTTDITSGPFNTTARNALSATAYIHGWKSFDFDEETQTGDFQEDIQEINNTSFRFIDYYQPDPAGEQPLECVPWESFRKQFDQSGAYPGLPRLITQDDTGRWRLYPYPYYRVSIKFEYDRQPQILTNYNDVPRGINNDFVDLIMWRAVSYWAVYDKQPDDDLRARKEYSNILSRLNQRDAPKFVFRPHRMY